MRSRLLATDRTTLAVSVKAWAASQRRPVNGLLLTRFLLAALGLLLSLTLPAAVRAQSDGVLTGQVLNGTSGAPDVGPGLPVTLYVFRGELQDAMLETTTDESGQFRFEDLDTDADLEYWTEAAYLGIPYSVAEPVRFSGESAAISADVTVYETTEDDSALTLDSVHMIAESFGEVLRISEIHLYGNAGDRTFVGGGGSAPQGTTLSIPIPPEAVGLAFTEGVAPDRYIEVEGGLIDTEPVIPGAESSLSFFSYHLMVSGTTIPLERSFAYPVTNLNLLVAQPGLALRSEQLISMGSELFQDRQYELFMAQGLDAGQVLLIEFTPQDVVADPATGGMPSAATGAETGSATRGSQGVLLWIGVGLTLLAVLSAAVYPQVTRRPYRPERKLRLASDPATRPLIVELAKLQDALEQGDLDQATYEQDRARIYEEIRSL